MPRIWQTWRERRRHETREQADARLAGERAALADDYRHVFASESGQRVLADLLRRAGVMQTSHDGNPMQTAYAEGKRRIGLELIEMINADPGAALRLATVGQTEELFSHG